MKYVWLAGGLIAACANAQNNAAEIRQRTERAIERQQRAVASMTGSLASQRMSVERQWHGSHTVDWPPMQPAMEFTNAVPVPSCVSLPSSEIDALVNKASERTAVAPELIRSVMWQESAFRPCAVSTRGAMGLMQLEPETADDLGVKDAFDPEANVMGGARLLKQLMERYGGDLSMTLSAYNAGSRRVDAAMGVPMIPETMDYVSRILSRLSSTNSTPGQAARESAPDMSLRLTGSESGK
jgi:soluble lytic murein transglycosylase-like protein